MSFVLMRWLLVGSWGRLVTRKTKPWLEAWNSHSHLQFSRGGNEANNWSCLPWWGCHKNPNSIVFRGLQVGEHIHTLGGWHTPNSTGTEALVLRPLPYHLDVSLHLAVYLYSLSYPLLYNNCKCKHYPEFWELFQQIIKSKAVEAMGTPNLYPSRTEVVGNLVTYYLWFASEAGGSLRDWALNLWDLTL